MSQFSSLPGRTASDNSVIKSSLKNLVDKLNVGHINLQSFGLGSKTGKFIEFKSILEGNFLHAVGVTETWTKQHNTNISLKVNGYKIYRNDRPKIRGGGVACFVSDKIKCKVIEKSVYLHVDQLEYLILELRFGRVRVMLGVFYYPNRNGRVIDEVLKVLDKYSSLYENIIVMGDFNNDLLKLDIFRRNFNLFRQASLEIVHNNIPTHFDFHNKSTSLLDFFLVSDRQLVNYSSQFWAHGLSHHAFIFLSYDIKPRVCQKEFYFRDFNSIDTEGLLREASRIHFEYIYNTGNPNEQLTFLNQVIKNLYDKYVPIKKFIPKESYDILNSPKLKWLRSLRDLALNDFHMNQTVDKRQVYCKIRNKCNAETKRLKHEFGKRYFSGDLSSKQMWRKIKEIGALGEEELSDISIPPDDLNNVFVDSRSGVRAVRTDTNIPESDNSVSFRNYDLNEVERAFKAIKSNSVGMDDIPIRFLNIILPVFGQHFLHLFNSINTSSIFPCGWKLAKIAPIPKVVDPMVASDFRPINLLPALSKVWELLLKEQILNFPPIIKNLYIYQSGFRKFHSTSTSILDITESIRCNFDKKFVSVLVSLDFCKAFDNIDHSILIYKLKLHFGFSTSACNLIYEYLSDRAQCVVVDNKFSSVRSVSRGVPQGSILGPILFSLFINDLPNVIRPSFCTTHLFADDVQLLFSSPIPYADICIGEINQELDKISRWCQSNTLTLNPAKSQAIIFHRGNQLALSSGIVVNGVDVPFKNNIKTLGFTLDCKLTFDDHVNNIISKVIFTLRKFYSISQYLPPHVKMKLMRSIIMSYFLYGAEVYSGTAFYNIDKLRHAFNMAIRFTFNVSRYNHNLGEFTRKIIQTTFDRFLLFRSMVMLYKVIKLRLPIYLFNRIQFTSSARLSGNITISHFSSDVMAKSFIIRLWKIWNDISFKGDKSVAEFKLNLIDYLNSARIDEVTGVNRFISR